MKKNIVSFLMLFLLMGMTVHAQIALAPAAVEDTAPMQAMRDSVTAFMDRLGVPGIIGAVWHEGHIIWSEGFGYADVENRVPVWPHTRMRIASISKPLTAAALALLYEQGRLNVDVPVQQYVSYFPEKPWPITTRQLAGHLGGIRHYRGTEFMSRQHYNRVRDALDVFKDDALLHQPGTRYSYSSYGWNLLSAVVEGASGTDFLAYMRTHVFDPLGMTNTVAEHPDSLIQHRARFYMKTPDGSLANAPYVDNSIKWAGGGFLSNAEDLVRFGAAFLGDKFVNAETRALLFTPQQTTAGETVDYGFGWAIRDLETRPMPGHSGGAMGGSSILLLDTEKNIAVAFIANMQSVPVTRLGREALRIFGQ